MMSFCFVLFWFCVCDIIKQQDLDRFSPNREIPVSPAFAAFMTGATYKIASGSTPASCIRVATLAGSLGLGAVGITYMGYSLLGIPYGNQGFLFF
jgi:hypothetical protein